MWALPVGVVTLRHDTKVLKIEFVNYAFVHMEIMHF